MCVSCGKNMRETDDGGRWTDARYYMVKYSHTGLEQVHGIFIIPQYIALFSKYDQYMPLLHERCLETLKCYGRLVIIPITWLNATGCGGGTLFDWMPEDSWHIYYTTVYITILKI